MEDERRDESAPASKPAYEPPQVEDVLTNEELAREVHYAGVQTVSEPIG